MSTGKPAPLYNAVELKRAFDESGLDALVVRSGWNVGYLSGMVFPGTLGRHQDFADTPRASMVVWPRDREPTLVTSKLSSALARRRSWLDDIRVYADYADSPYVISARILKEKGLAHGRIGVERREFGADRWDSFRAELPHAELTDCGDLLQRVRNIKTKGELELLKRAADVQDQAHLDVFRNARPGDTERELHSRMIGAMLRHGVESAHGQLQASSNPVHYGSEGPTPVNRGDAIRTDYVCYLEGYAANLSRMAVMGPPSADQEMKYRVLLDVYNATVAKMLWPGVRACDVSLFVRQGFEHAGYSQEPRIVGHSIGVWWHQEPPILVPTDPRRLAAGMVICLEPKFDSFWHIQDEFLVTETGPRLLSDAFETDRLFIMGEG